MRTFNIMEDELEINGNDLIIHDGYSGEEIVIKFDEYNFKEEFDRIVFENNDGEKIEIIFGKNVTNAIFNLLKELVLTKVNERIWREQAKNKNEINKKLEMENYNLKNENKWLRREYKSIESSYYEVLKEFKNEIELNEEEREELYSLIRELKEELWEKELKILRLKNKIKKDKFLKIK